MGLISCRGINLHNRAETVKEEKEPTPSSSKLSAPIRGLIGCEMVRIGSLLFAVLAFGAFGGCRRRRRGAGGLGLGRLWGFATATRGGFAVAGGRGGGYWGRSICGFAHIFRFCLLAAMVRSREAFSQETCQPDFAGGKGRQGIVL